ncbi:hypothetical protein JCM10914A_26770 [Paenibacillus sp. JCM 10914]|uniref:pirin family protein n=1 Tax=Paenibacillus sp. JCM 10914 TaxID=1236974 RepID=UPI0003CC4D66|nr:pirin family protein [Paenibacillus sp. JCM 10914]GAE07755.1 pirin-like protein YhhW, possibly qercetin 2,3-dioxygenase activity [Paenibacillus sp. JCM 10914]
MIGTLHSPESQSSSVLDGGRITEQKPIGLSGEGSAVTRVGPLFYWSWFRSSVEGYIAPHPHQGFEIVTYIIQGKSAYKDSHGTQSDVGPGGLQLLRAGSGVTHEERMTGPDVEGFQIWFEPYLRDSLKQNPAFRQYRPDSFPVSRVLGGLIKTVIGHGAPPDLSVDVRMLDYQVLAGNQATYELESGRRAAALAVRGSGSFRSGGDALSFGHRDFMVIDTESGETLTLDAQENVRILLIDVPVNPGYPLYSKRP